MCLLTDRYLESEIAIGIIVSLGDTDEETINSPVKFRAKFGSSAAGLNVETQCESVGKYCEISFHVICFHLGDTQKHCGPHVMTCDTKQYSVMAVVKQP